MENDDITKKLNDVLEKLEKLSNANINDKLKLSNEILQDVQKVIDNMDKQNKI